MRELTFCEALLEAQDQALTADSNVFIMGEGVDDTQAVFGSVRGLQDKFGEQRVFDMPLAENGMTGVAIGAALSGKRPIMTHQRIDFTLYAMDQLVNHAAKRCYSSGGAQCVPITIRAIVGRGWGQGTQHSQSLQALFAHIPGLKVAMPSSPYDAKGMLLASIEDPNPVIFIEYRKLYDEVGPVPEEMYFEPLGKGAIRREGQDVTLVASSYMVVEALEAANRLEKVGIDVEVVDLRTVKPLDEDLILSSVAKTGRLVVADTGWKTCGIASEVAACVAEKGFDHLKAAVRRISLPDVPTPTTPALEEVYYPGAAQIAEAAYEIVKGGRAGIDSVLVATEDKVGQEFIGPF